MGRKEVIEVLYLNQNIQDQREKAQNRKKHWYDFVKLKLCRNVIADRFSINLLFVFSLVAWDKGRNLGPKMRG